MVDSGNLPLMTIKESKKFFKDAGIHEEEAETYAKIFRDNNMRESVLATLDKCALKDMNITKYGDVCLILQHVSKIYNQKNLTVGTSTEDFNWSMLSSRLTKENKSFRKDIYVAWANLKNISPIFELFIKYVADFFRNYYVTSDDTTEDILYAVFKKQNQFTLTESTRNLTVELNSHDTCLRRPFIVSKDILKKFDRSQLSSSITELGYQHLFINNMVDTSASESTSEDLLDSEDKDSSGRSAIKKLRKTCQLGIEVDCQGLLAPHSQNNSYIRSTTTRVDVLILVSCGSSTYKLCQNLAKHLGLNFIDDLIIEAEQDAITKGKMMKSQNPDSKVYKLVQTYINRNLMFGHNNIALTCSDHVFLHCEANVKCFIYNEACSTQFIIFKRYLHYSVEITDTNPFLQCIAAIAELINNIFLCNAHVQAIYSKNNSSSAVVEYFRIKFPLIGVIPMYIVDFFASKRSLESPHTELI